MRNNLFKFLSVLFLVILISFTFSACSTAENSVTEKQADYSGELTDSETALSETSVSERKIIETVDFEVQTKEFDALVERVKEKVAKEKGYIESSDISGREFDSDNNRYANFKIRIPSEKSKDFSSFISENSVIINEALSTEDITLKYVDTESRISALKTQKAALEQLLQNANSMDDIIAIQDKLTEVIYNLESYQSQLKKYDNLVAYSTITLNIYEVERTVAVKKQGVFQEIGSNLKNNFSNIWQIIVRMFVFVVSAIPYLLFIGILVLIPLVIIKIAKRKTKNDKTASEK